MKKDKRFAGLGKFLKSCTLLIAISTGIISYFVYAHISLLDNTHHIVGVSLKIIQPVLIFCTLFIAFCKINPRDLRWKKWHLWLLLMQAGSFMALTFILWFFPDISGKLIIEAAMICLICPTAASSPVITEKLGGDVSSLTTYCVLANLLSAFMIPICLPIIYPISGHTFWGSFFQINIMVFPMLIFPVIFALIARFFIKPLHILILKTKDLAFYIWSFTLYISTGMATRYVMHSNASLWILIGLFLISMIVCVVQFWLGRKIGKHYHSTIAAGQALGQKNTIFAIWMGLSFLPPVTSFAGAAYALWHNIYNSWQLYKHKQ